MPAANHNHFKLETFCLLKKSQFLTLFSERQTFKNLFSFLSVEEITILTYLFSFPVRGTAVVQNGQTLLYEPNCKQQNPILASYRVHHNHMSLYFCSNMKLPAVKFLY